MTISVLSDGRVALDWTTARNIGGSPLGPFVVLTISQYAELKKEMRKQ